MLLKVGCPIEKDGADRKPDDRTKGVPRNLPKRPAGQSRSQGRGGSRKSETPENGRKHGQSAVRKKIMANVEDMLSGHRSGLVDKPCVNDDAERNDEKQHQGAHHQDLGRARNSAEEAKEVHVPVDSGHRVSRRQRAPSVLGAGHSSCATHRSGPQSHAEGDLRLGKAVGLGSDFQIQVIDREARFAAE